MAAVASHAALSIAEGDASAEYSAASFANLLQRTARLLPLNSPKEVQDMKHVLTKIVENVLAHPEEPKYRSLRLSNKALRSKIFDRSGGAEVMRVLNFRRSVAVADTL